MSRKDSHLHTLLIPKFNQFSRQTCVEDQPAHEGHVTWKTHFTTPQWRRLIEKDGDGGSGSLLFKIWTGPKWCAFGLQRDFCSKSVQRPTVRIMGRLVIKWMKVKVRLRERAGVFKQFVSSDTWGGKMILSRNHKVGRRVFVGSRLCEELAVVALGERW